MNRSFLSGKTKGIPGGGKHTGKDLEAGKNRLAGCGKSRVNVGRRDFLKGWQREQRTGAFRGGFLQVGAGNKRREEWVFNTCGTRGPSRLCGGAAGFPRRCIFPGLPGRAEEPRGRKKLGAGPLPAAGGSHFPERGHHSCLNSLVCWGPEATFELGEMEEMTQVP